jgi:hypothetical protein
MPFLYSGWLGSAGERSHLFRQRLISYNALCIGHQKGRNNVKVKNRTVLIFLWHSWTVYGELICPGSEPNKELLPASIAKSLHDGTKAQLASQIGPYPLAQHIYGLCRFHEEVKMKSRPDDPNENAIQLRLFGLQIANPSHTTARSYIPHISDVISRQFPVRGQASARPFLPAKYAAGDWPNSRSTVRCVSVS